MEAETTHPKGNIVKYAAKWKTANEEIHVIDDSGNARVYKFNRTPWLRITLIAKISDGKRIDIKKRERGILVQESYKKIK